MWRSMRTPDRVNNSIRPPTLKPGNAKEFGTNVMDITK